MGREELDVSCEVVTAVTGEVCFTSQLSQELTLISIQGALDQALEKEALFPHEPSSYGVLIQI